MINNEPVHFSLKYLPLLIRLRCCEPARLPGYLGSTLHGILGWALLNHKEAYRYIYENRKMAEGGYDIPNPYIINPPGYREQYNKGDELRFQVILLGDALRYAEQLINALITAGSFTIGAERKRFQLEEIMQYDQLQSIWKPGLYAPEAIKAEAISEHRTEGCTNCSIQLLTPLRIRRGGSLLTELDFITIFRSISRRITELTARYGGYVNEQEIAWLMEAAQHIQKTSSGLYVKNMERYSTRRDKKMDLSGLLGAMTFQGELAPFTPWLNAACILHLGRNTTLGCGKIDAVIMN